MSSRHALVIGSQCDALPNQRLSFLPDRARGLFEVLTDPLRGGCEAAPTSVFLTDPTMEELRQAVSTAVAKASAAGATLVFAFIGHAVTAPSRYSQPLFLLPADGNPNTPGTETAYEIGHRLGEMDMAGLDGLIIILDACHAGAGVRDVIKSGLDLEQQVRLELLAGTFLRKARNGCFSQALIRLMEHGAPGLSADYLEIRHAANVAADYCRTVQQPPVYIGSGFGQNASDPGLWVSRNVASPGKWLLSGTEEGALAVALTQSFQPTNDLGRVTAAMSGQRLVVLQGGAGSGKSALIAALARP
ncbi:caspase family protein [Arthrobacter sp. ISL-65]|uniref:caspase family protein n=1 Tax=Arthrobacter sp. ISL-65 TaxID=2819112 RepID=UPI001BE997F9|nr:caspase family protein [Arthrobacter sp. ISL-65]MBT2548153.1 caspase family protein [Arthrobacter sp. ISL-65]